MQTSLPTGQEQTVIFRNYQQISWLHDRIAEKYHSILLPPMPEKPSRNGDSVYVEKKRLQMERFLSKLFGREEIMDNSDLQYFLSDQMVLHVLLWNFSINTCIYIEYSRLWQRWNRKISISSAAFKGALTLGIIRSFVIQNFYIAC